jgi:hypothetical protein
MAWKSVATPFAAGKNKIINGDFRINQRSLTSTTTDGAYGFDRWRMYASSGGTYSAQTFTAGTAPVAGYEGVNFARIVTTGQSGAGVYTSLDQPIEDVRTFAGQTVTVSFWAKAASGTPVVSLEFVQIFGSGGSGPSFLNAGTVTLSTSWTRYTKTVSIPSISGNTIGTGSTLDFAFWVSAGTSFASRANSIGIQSNTFDFWGVQVEQGSTATAFQTATGTLQGELAACQRYYYRITPTVALGRLGFGNVTSTTAAEIGFAFPVTMRTAPTALEQSGTAGDYSVRTGATNTTCSAVPAFNTAEPSQAFVNFTVASGLTAANAAIFRNVNTSAYLGWSAEL